MSKRSICPDCERPIKTCLCSEIIRFNCDYQLIILQDPTEAKHALSSAPILTKSIIGSRLIIGEKFDPNQILDQNWQQETLLVFPSKNSLSSKQAQQQRYKNVILLDGTWRKVARLLHLNPWLTELPSIAIKKESTSKYLIRKSPRKDGLSTIEAAVSVLNDLHCSQDYTPILGAFHKMVDLQIQAMGKDTFHKNYANKEPE